MRQRLRQLGIGVKEVTIVTVIIVTFALISIATYRAYQRRQYYQTLVQAVTPYKKAIEECFIATGDLDACNNNQHGVPDLIPEQNQHAIKHIIVKHGVICLVPQEAGMVHADDVLQLTPCIVAGDIAWKSSGKSVGKGYAN